MRKFTISDDEDVLCANCGTDLRWWQVTKHKKVYIDNADELYCSKKCFIELQKPTLKEIEVVSLTRKQRRK